MCLPSALVFCQSDDSCRDPLQQVQFVHVTQPSVRDLVDAVEGAGETPVDRADGIGVVAQVDGADGALFEGRGPKKNDHSAASNESTTYPVLLIPFFGLPRPVSEGLVLREARGEDLVLDLHVAAEFCGEAFLVRQHPVRPGPPFEYRLHRLLGTGHAGE